MASHAYGFIGGVNLFLFVEKFLQAIQHDVNVEVEGLEFIAV